MELPKRTAQHTSETASYKILASKIPHSWILRDVTERDYGIDCYLELTNNQDELTGELALLQVKSLQSIPWTKNEDFTLTGIKISTTNYWFSFPIPVFIFLVDLNANEVYLNSVNLSITRNYEEYSKQRQFNYRFKKIDKVEGFPAKYLFRLYFGFASLRPRFESELVTFLSNKSYYQQFIDEHWNRDFHLGIEDEDLIFLEAMYRNYRFLCQYCNIEWKIPSLEQMKRKSKDKFGDEFPYELYEHDVSEFVQELENTTPRLITVLKSFLQGEMAYWLHTNPTIYKCVLRL
jgi:Domain of unknown function (DUF4365)